jgi:hypothetical protein
MNVYVDESAIRTRETNSEYFGETEIPLGLFEICIQKSAEFSHVADLDYQAEVSEHEYQTQNERVSGNVSVREGEEGSS